jgi:hypothetical protein
LPTNEQTSGLTTGDPSSVQISGLTNSQISEKIRARTINAPTGRPSNVPSSSPTTSPTDFRGSGQWIGLEDSETSSKVREQIIAPTGSPSNVPTTSSPTLGPASGPRRRPIQGWGSVI